MLSLDRVIFWEMVDGLFSSIWSRFANDLSLSCCFLISVGSIGLIINALMKIGLGKMDDTGSSFLSWSALRLSRSGAISLVPGLYSTGRSILNRDSSVCHLTCLGDSLRRDL